MGADRPPYGFEPFEHTADIGLHAWGRTAEELFAEAALGMVWLLVNPEKVRVAETREITFSAMDLEEALIVWLQEILYLYEVKRFIPASIEVREVRGGSVRARLHGEPVDRARHELKTDIKAATYHDLRIERVRQEDGSELWRTRIIFDI